MLISPPFLPADDVNQDQADEDFVDALMPQSGFGRFPVGEYRQWHGGRHLQAPSEDSFVRAIADGKVAYVRQSSRSKEVGDNGCVILKHDTEIGENVPVTFYSIYMHLGQIEAEIVQGRDIHRKAKLGKAGIIYDEASQIHFEIIADAENTRRLVGGMTLDAPNFHVDAAGCRNHYLTHDGRTDACFGSMYFIVPAGLPLYVRKRNKDREKQMKAELARQHRKGSVPLQYDYILDWDEELSNLGIYPQFTHDYAPDLNTGIAFQLETLFVEMRYHKGECTFISYTEKGEWIGEVHSKGNSRYDGSIHEYNLYDAAMALYPSRPTAGFELLRFGRVIGDEDFAEDEKADIKHYREIATRDGTFWVNLNSPYVRKYSDADMPFWKGWGIVNDDRDNDGHCDSAIVDKILTARWMARYGYLLSPGNDPLNDPSHRLNPTIANNTLNEISHELDRLVYRFPSEWSAANFDERFKWVIEEDGQEVFDTMKKEIAPLLFWEEAKLGIELDHYHFHPVEFIKHFRKCGWLSLNEMKQLVPSNSVVGESWGTVAFNDKKEENFTNLYTAINKVLRKYCINTPLRMASFFGNALEETGFMQTLEEGDSVRAHMGKHARYAPWYGRGMLQLTFESNYDAYWKFKGINLTETQKTAEREKLANNIYPEPADSAGFYWIFQNHRNIACSQHADEKHVLERVTIKSGHVYYRSQAFWHVAAAVNLPGAIGHTNYQKINGFDSRCSAYGNCLAVLTELKFPDAQGQKRLEFPEGYKQRSLNEQPPKQTISPHHRNHHHA